MAEEIYQQLLTGIISRSKSSSIHADSALDSGSKSENSSEFSDFGRNDRAGSPGSGNVLDLLIIDNAANLTDEDQLVSVCEWLVNL